MKWHLSFICACHILQKRIFMSECCFFPPRKKKNPAWHPFNWIHREFLRNLHSAYQDDWCCSLEQNGYNPWTTGQLLTWVSAEHRGFMPQKPETQCGKEHCTVLQCASLLWNCEGRIPETRNTFSSFLLQDTEVFNCWKPVHSAPKIINNGIKEHLNSLSKSS